MWLVSTITGVFTPLPLTHTPTVCHSRTRDTRLQLIWAVSSHLVSRSISRVFCHKIIILIKLYIYIYISFIIIIIIINPTLQNKYKHYFKMCCACHQLDKEQVTDKDWLFGPAHTDWNVVLLVTFLEAATRQTVTAPITSRLSQECVRRQINRMYRVGR